MTLIVDTASAMRRLPHDKFERWAATRTVFLSSEMRELEGLRRTVGDALRAAGFSVVMFEDLGGRDEDAERAYLDGVARGDLYVGVIANRYGTMLASGRSPTHEEYREARRLGRRISVWVDRDDSQRQGNAADFVQELQTFHTTGQFANANDLVTRLLQRLSEIAADDEAPWVKLGDVCLRAQTIEDRGSTIRVKAEVRDTTAVDALERYRPGQIRRAEPRQQHRRLLLLIIDQGKTTSIDLLAGKRAARGQDPGRRRVSPSMRSSRAAAIATASSTGLTASNSTDQADHARSTTARILRLTPSLRVKCSTS